MTVVDRLAGFLDGRLSRRSLLVRSAFTGSALAAGGLEFMLKPGTAYAACICGSGGCGCGSTCCNGYTEFCCVVNGGYNYCPENTVMAGWWKAAGSAYCSGPRYYMDCNATCQCATGCGSGFPFCDTECDGTNCGCGPEGCTSFMVGCLRSSLR